MTNPLLPLFKRIELKPAWFAGDELVSFQQSMVEYWKQARLICETKSASTVTCVDCGVFTSRVQWVHDRINDTMQPYLGCPECGPIKIEIAQLKRWSLDVKRILEVLAESSGIKAAIREVTPTLWKVGNAPWASRSREVYFLQHFARDDLDAILNQLQSHRKAVLLMPTELAVDRWQGITENPIFSLENVFTFENGIIQFGLGFLEGRLHEYELEAKSNKKRARPTRKRARRATNIERLVEELIKHIKDAKEYAKFTEEQTGVSKLLPRPTQKQLGKHLDISEATVSRCINDKKAIKLKMLWKTANNLEELRAKVIGHR